MISLTKEWLQQTIAELEEERDATPGAVNEDAAMALSAMKLALVSLEADSKLSDFVESQESLGGEFEGVLTENIESLYVTSNPAVKITSRDLDEGFDKWYTGDGRGTKSIAPDWFSEALKPVFLETWRACRAAMLQAEPVSQPDELQSRIAELGSHKAALLKFIRDSCYVFDGDDEDISDAYVDAITSGMMTKLEAVAVCNPPLFWVRVKSDGGYDGPIHDSKLEDVRKKSGEWLPLTLACVDASRQPSEVSCRAAMLQGAEPVTTANKLPFEQWLSQQTGTIDVECGCVMTEVFFHWLRVAYEAGNYPVIPDGWVIVPIEPTEHMIVEGFESEPDEFFSDEEVWEAYDAMSGCQQAAHRAKLCWAAMIEAAPKLE